MILNSNKKIIKALDMGYSSMLYYYLNIRTFSILLSPKINVNINYNNISHK